MYRLEKEQSGKKQVEEIIETKEGSLSRLLSIDDRPLSAKQQEEENKRVQEFMTNRSAKRKLQRELEEATLQGRRLFKMLPDAFVFDYAGGDGNLVKLTFRSNPNFHPLRWRPACSTTWKARCGWTANRNDWLCLVVISHGT
jgi:hypothetical protein